MAPQDDSSPRPHRHSDSGDSDEWFSERTPRIALGVAQPRDRELLESLLSAFEVIDVAEPVPERTDICIVDADGLASFREALLAWKARERPTTAPVLLLTTDSVDEAWRRHGDSVGELLDGIQSIPAPRKAVRSRVDGLLATRRYSVLSRQRQQELELYERAIDTAGIGISIADANEDDLPLVYVNEEFLEITEYDREAVIGRNCRFLQGENTEESTVDEMRSALADERPVSVEVRNYRRSGEQFWNALDIMPVRDEDGEVTHFLGFQRDVTERKRRERLLEQYQRIFESIEDPVLVLDDNGRIVDTNAAAKAAFGVDGTIPEGTPAPSLFEGKQAAKFRTATAAVRGGGSSRTMELTTTGPDGNSTVFQFRFQRLEATDDYGERIIAVSRDITRIQEYQNRLSVLDRIFRHNIRNKLNIVTGLAELLEADGDEEVAAIADDIDTAASDLLAIADAARAFNRSIDPTKPRTQELDLSAFVREVGEELRESYPDVDIDISAPGATQAVCPATIRLCLEHLVENAVKHAGVPAPRVEIEVEETDDREWVELRVNDDGPGFSERERRALTSGAERPLEHLQGVTLWLIRWAVTNAGGQLDIRNHSERGATVVLRLPAAEEQSPT
ncbi:PAS domain S-box protein [Natronomonas gomsonensis]|uniref:PAS domain S-box protein n=1 Tax=Natronomonas gomsonensis TaxID=1046043 RepID=UPI0015B7C6BB|nr:PAS domain S-box protein [Natronomonas gomsonensis]